MTDNYIDGEYQRALNPSALNPSAATRPSAAHPSAPHSSAVPSPFEAGGQADEQVGEQWPVVLGPTMTRAVTPEELTLDDCVFALVCSAIEVGDGFVTARLAEEIEMLDDLSVAGDSRLSLALVALRLVSDGSKLTGARLLRALKRDPRFAAIAEEAAAVMSTEAGRDAVREAAHIIEQEGGGGGEELEADEAAEAEAEVSDVDSAAQDASDDGSVER